MSKRLNWSKAKLSNADPGAMISLPNWDFAKPAASKPTPPSKSAANLARLNLLARSEAIRLQQVAWKKSKLVDGTWLGAKFKKFKA